MRSDGSVAGVPSSAATASPASADGGAGGATHFGHWRAEDAGCRSMQLFVSQPLAAAGGICGGGICGGGIGGGA